MINRYSTVKRNSVAAPGDFGADPTYTGPHQRTPTLALAAASQQNQSGQHFVHHTVNQPKAAPKYLVIADVLALLIGLITAWGLASSINSFYLDRNYLSSFNNNNLHRVAEFIAIATGVVVWLSHTGHYRIRMPFWQEVRKICNTIGFAILIDSFVQVATKQDSSRLWLILGWVFAGIAILTLRSALRRFLRRKGLWQIPTLLVGDGNTASDARAALEANASLGYVIVDQLTNLPETYLKAAGSWGQICAEHGASYVMIALDGDALAKAEEPLAQLARESIPFSILPPMRSTPVFGMMPQYFFNHDVMLLTRSDALEQPLPRLIKRSFDLVVSILAILVLLPFFLAIIVLVKKDGGTGVYSHRRLGMNGKPFGCLKFRSMRMNSGAILKQYLSDNSAARMEWQKTQKLRDDPRVTRIGAFLRRTSLDELPQLFNVLKGDMSLVGPRPIVAAEIMRYDNDIAHYYRVRPGITGLWQVSGRNDTTYARRVQMDGWYVRNWSMWHDIAILFKTIPALLDNKGAY